MSRDAFRGRLLDPSTDNETVDRLRRAAKGIVEARTLAQLGAAGADLAAAAQAMGVERFSRFLGDAERRAVAAVLNTAIPGVVKASAAGADMAAGAVGLGLVLLMMALKNQGSGPARPILTPSNPTDVTPATPKDDKAGKASQAAPSADAGQDLSPGPGDVVISDDRRKHILNGDANGSGGGHGPGRNRPNKTEFPPDWSDDRVIDAIRDVANDPASSRETEPDGRIKATGSRDGVDIRGIVEADKRTVVTGYPTNLPRNPRRSR